MKIINLTEIKAILKNIDIIPIIEKGFVAYSNGQAILPPIGEMIFDNPVGEVHIKYGYIVNDDYYVIKVASGFHDNPALNLPSSNGLMLLFNQKTGELLSILLDEGYLTDLRTAAAGAIAAKYLAPSVHTIGIIGTGTQAKFQLLFLKSVIDCRDVIVFGRNNDRLMQFQTDMINTGFHVTIAKTMKEITTCNLIVTTTPASRAILFSEHIKPGTHITAIGADSPNKQELHENIFAKADIIVADSISQCLLRGDISHAIRKNIIDHSKLITLGNIISGKCKARTSENQITIADLTGLAVQDLQIAKAVYEAALQF